MFYERHLPHWHPENAPLFVTWCLNDSLPRINVEEKATPGQQFVRMDRELDAGQIGPLWLRDDRIAGLVADVLRFGDRELRMYELVAWVIMPNHVHIVIVPAVPLCKIMKTLKGYSARKANEILARSQEVFWQNESYDHWVREPKEMSRIVSHIEYNPVKAGLAESPELFRWSSAYSAGLEARATHAIPPCLGLR